MKYLKNLIGTLLLTISCYTAGMNNPGIPDYADKVEYEETNPEEEIECLQELNALSLGVKDPLTHKHKYGQNLQANKRCVTVPFLSENSDPAHKRRRTGYATSAVIIPRDKIAFAEQQVAQLNEEAQRAEKEYKKILIALRSNDVYQIILRRDQMVESLTNEPQNFAQLEAEFNKQSLDILHMITQLSLEICALEQQIANENQKEHIEQIERDLEQKKHIHQGYIRHSQLLTSQLEEKNQKRRLRSKTQQEIFHLSNKIAYLLSFPDNNTSYTRLSLAANQAKAHYDQVMHKLQQAKALCKAFKQKENQSNDATAVAREEVRKPLSTGAPLRDLCPVNVTPRSFLRATNK